MPSIIAITLASAIFIILLLAGLYIHSVLFAAGIAGLVLLEGPKILTGFLGAEPFYTGASFTLTTIPLFILMAQFVLQSGIVNDFFYIIHRLSKGRGGVLGTLTIIGGGFLGAVAGSGVASSAALGQIAVPELRKRGFKPELAAAVAASAGSLSSIIPPSIVLILYGVATETPIGDLFIAAVIPGCLVLAAFIAVMLFYYKRSHNDSEGKHGGAAEDEQVPLFRLALAVFLGICIVFIIFGGLYSGFITATEAGAAGAFVAFLTTLILGRVNMTFLVSALGETIKVTGMIMLILIGAKVFGRFISLSMLPRQLAEFMEPLMGYPALVLAILAVVFFLLFMFLEGAAVILMAIPVTLPMIKALDVDLVWFGVFVSVIATIGLLTPPVGLSVYTVAGVTKMPSESIFRHAMPFAIITAVVVCGLLIAFPVLATWAL